MAWRRAIRLIRGVLVCGVWGGCGHDAYYDYSFPDECGGGGFVDGRARVLYRQGCTGITAHRVEPDGSLTRTGHRDHLTRVDRLPPAGGRMAVTFPPPTVAGHP